jgi:hypothetical protein
MLKLIESTPTPMPTLELKATEITTPTPTVTPTPTPQSTPTSTPTKEEKTLPTNTATVEETPTPLPTWSPTPTIIDTVQSISKDVELTGKGRLAMLVEPNVEADSIKHVAALDVETPPDDLENAVYFYDGEDNLVMSVVNAVTTYYVGGYYEKTVDGAAVTERKKRRWVLWAPSCASTAA